MTCREKTQVFSLDSITIKWRKKIIETENKLITIEHMTTHSPGLVQALQ